MRTLELNKRKIYYALFVEETADVDEWGNETGETTPVYSSPIELKANVSAAGGSDEVNVFGSFADYSRTLTVAGQCEMDENSIVWFGADPATEPHNYIVVAKADSKNNIVYALKQVYVR